MSERNHSPNTTQARPARGRLVPILTGTAVLLCAAAVAFQVFRANPAASQTADGAGRSGLSPSPSDRVLAKVNNQSITYDVVARECVARHGKEVLENLVNRLIIQQECERRGVTISKAEVEQEVIATAKKFNLPLDTWYKMLESERGLTREQYHDDIIWPMIALKKLAGQNVDVTEKDMQEGFERDYGPRVKARLILIEGNVRQANQVWEKCQAAPDDFDRIAREHSADPNTRPLGGVIPPIRKHGGSKQIEEQAFKMRTGEVSPVVQIAENRYVILKCEGFTDPVVDDIRAVWNDLYKQLVEERTQLAVAKVFEEVKKNARVDNYLSNKSTGPRAPVQQTGGIRSPGAATPAAASGSQSAARQTLPATTR